ncbi:MAG: RNA-binding S4 domain-containing protein [Verrucomicrobia bacterium]|nr:MAG: RNA-binding S4 domain-containing protein [Verrucomicrobiota bacterium]
MNRPEEMRVDKWLFAVRLFKTRAQAAEACRSGKVRLNDSPAKSAKLLRVGDTISVRQNPITRTLEVVGLTERRVGAKLVADFADDKTPPAELEKLRLAKLERGDSAHKKPGRPSKRDRRLIHRFTDCAPPE